MKRIYLALFLLLGLLAMPAAFAAVPGADVALSSTSSAWDLIVQYGPIWGGMILAFAIASEFLKRNESEHWIAQGRALALIVGGVGLLGAVLEAQLGGGSWAGVIVTLFGVVKLIISPQVKPGTSAATVAVLAFIAFASTQTACKPYAPPSIAPIVDCINADRQEIDPLIASFWPKDGSKPDWGKIESQAISAGLNVGGCALSEFVEKYLTPAPGNHAPDPSSGQAASKALEDYRAKHANGATFRTKLGDL